MQKPDYIRSDDPAVILDGSPHFVRVRAEAFVSDYGYYAELWRCTVTETYKGGLAAEETEVLFLPGTVEAGGEYYLLLKERLMENLPYRLSSKHSLYEADDPAAEGFPADDRTERMKPHRRTVGGAAVSSAGKTDAHRRNGRASCAGGSAGAPTVRRTAGAREKTFANICKKGLHIPAGCDTMTKSRAFAQALGRSRLRKSGIEKFGGN